MLDAVRYEFVRLRSLRSTWVLFVTGPVIQFLFSVIWATHQDMAARDRYRTIVTTTLTLRTPARILGAVVFAALSCLVGLGVAALCRNAAVALVAMIAFPTIIETLLLLTRIDPSLIPFYSAAKLITTANWTAPLALLGLVVVFLSGSWVTLRRRDA